MLASFAVSSVNVNISAMVIESSGALPSAAATLARRWVSGIAIDVLGSIAVAVNCTDCEIFAAVTRTVVLPAVRPSVKRACALPLRSVIVDVVLSRPLPAVIANVTGTPANARLC